MLALDLVALAASALAEARWTSFCGERDLARRPVTEDDLVGARTTMGCLRGRGRREIAQGPATEDELVAVRATVTCLPARGRHEMLQGRGALHGATTAEPAARGGARGVRDEVPDEVLGERTTARSDGGEDEAGTEPPCRSASEGPSIASQRRLRRGGFRVKELLVWNPIRQIPTSSRN